MRIAIQVEKMPTGGSPVTLPEMEIESTEELRKRVNEWLTQVRELAGQGAIQIKKLEIR